MSSTTEPDNVLLHYVLAHAHVHRAPVPPSSFMDEIIPGLYLGSYEAADETATLHAQGVTHILTVLNWVLDKQAQGFTTLRIELDDAPWMNMAQFFDQAITFIDGALSPPEVDGSRESSGGVLVHCAAGVSRSATVVAAYLMARHGMTPSQALDHIVERRPCVEPNEGFIRQLYTWHTAGCVYVAEDIGKVIDRFDEPITFAPARGFS